MWVWLIMCYVVERVGVLLKIVLCVINEEFNVVELMVVRVNVVIVEFGFCCNDFVRLLRYGCFLVMLGMVIEDVVNLFYSAIMQVVEIVECWVG